MTKKKKVNVSAPKGKVGRPKKLENKLKESAEVDTVGKLGKAKVRAKKVKKIPNFLNTIAF